MIVAGGTTLSAARLRAIVLLGGDTTATIEDGTDDNPAVRGGHMLVRYMSPLNHYYEQWHGRMLHAIAQHAQDRYSSPSTLASVVSGIVQARLADVVPAVWDKAGDAIAAHAARVGLGSGTVGADKRFRLFHAGSRVVTATHASTFAAQKHAVDAADARKLRSDVITFFAASGQTAVDLIGQSTDYSGQLVQLQSANRDYMEQVARFNADKQKAADEDRAARRSAQGSLVANVLGMATKAFL